MNDHSSNVDFTIITPVYNGAKWIRETIESVLKYSAEFKFEYIVIDDGSTDDTAIILNDFQNRIVIISTSNQGEAASVNNGLNKAKGKYILVVSADDPMRSDQLFTEAKKILDFNSEVVCVYPDWAVINSESKIVNNIKVSEYSQEVLLGEFKCIVGPGGVFRRDQALLIGGRDSKYRFVSDYDFWLRLSQTGRFERIPFSLAFWREHEHSTSIASRGHEMAKERISVIEDFVLKHPSFHPKLKHSALGHAYFSASILVFFDSSIPARRYLLKSLCHFPKGVYKFDTKQIMYILLLPFSPKILSIIRHIKR